MRSLAILAVALVLSACDREAEASATEVANPRSDASVAERLCVGSGGRWARTPQGGSTCYTDAPDANRSCDGADDCAGACLARSRSCAPVIPLTGCHEVLTRGGTVAMQCRAS